MNHLSHSRKSGEGKSFEILQTEDQVTILIRDRGSDQICQIVSFRGQAEVKPREVGPDLYGRLLGAPSSTGRRW